MKKHSKVTSITKQQTVGQRHESGKREIRELLKKIDHAAMEQHSGWGVGIDIGDKKSNYCFVDASGKIAAEGALATSREEFGHYFCRIPKMRVALEVGTHSPWVSELLEALGHEVYVANPRKMESIHKNKRKNDKVDARVLGRIVRLDPELLYPIRHRGAEARHDLVLLRARDALVSARTGLINSMRGMVKSVGARLPKCSADTFHKQVIASIPDPIKKALLPMVAQIATLTEKIREYDRQVNQVAAKKYPETGMLKQVNGVGELTSLAYVLTLENPERFKKSREVGPYLGLVPKQDESGESSPQLGITKTGDMMLRRLLVGSAQYILGPFGADCDLRRFGLKLAARGGKNAKRRAVVAVARKLGVLLHRLWTTAEVYEPLRQQELALTAEVKG